MTPRVVVAPAIEPVLLPEAKRWCKIDADITEEDSDIAGLIIAAREFCEHRKAYAFYEQTLEVDLHCWPGHRLELPRATPLRSIESVTYQDSDGISQVVSSADYNLNTSAVPGQIVFIENYSWPDVDRYAANPITIRYVAGQPNVSPMVPFSSVIKLAMKQLIQHWYRNREAVIVGASASVAATELPIGVAALLNVNQEIYKF